MALKFYNKETNQWEPLIMVNNKTPYESIKESGSLDKNVTEDKFNSKLGELVNKDVCYCISTTYANLKSLRDKSQLLPGTLYVITDYQTKVSHTLTDVRSANWRFNIVVKALSTDTLSEDAKIIDNSFLNGNHFDNSNVNAWKIKYTLDNDTERFSWARQYEDIEAVTGEWYLNDYKFKEANTKEDDFLPIETIDIEYTTYEVIKLDMPSKIIPDTTGLGSFGIQYSEEEFEQFRYVSSQTPVISEDPSDSPYDPYGGSSKQYDWSRVTTIDVYLGPELVTTLESDGNGIFIDNRCGLDARFSPDPLYDGGEYFYEPVYNSDWHLYRDDVDGNGVTSGSYNWTEDSSPSWGDDIYAIYDSSNNITRLYDYMNHRMYGYISNANVITITHIPFSPYIAGGGKGVIYRMIDEHNNDCPYDFKNIQFLKDGRWYYTFSYDDGKKDLSLTDFCRNNYIAEHRRHNDLISDNQSLVANIPKLVLDAPEQSGGIFGNRFCVGVTKGYLRAQIIENFEWKSPLDRSPSVIDNIYINVSAQCYGNSICGRCDNFVVGTKDKSVNYFMYNDIKFPSITKPSFTCTSTGISMSTIDGRFASGSIKFEGGDIINCGINIVSGSATLISNVALANCSIKMSKSLTINYPNTTSSTNQLYKLNISADTWKNNVELAIPESFPLTSEYELKIAKNSKGEIKMWCDADLIQ